MVGKSLSINPLNILNIATFCRAQFLLPVLFLFYQKNNLTLGDFFLFQGIVVIVGLLFEIPSGYLADVCSKKNVLILSFLCFLVRAILWIFFSGYNIILVGEIFNALSKILYVAVSDSYIYEYLKLNGKTEKMLSKYGKLNFFFFTGTAITSVFGAIFYNNFGITTILSLDFIFTLFAIFLLFFLPQLPVSHKKYNSKIKKKLLKIFAVIKSSLKNKRINSYIFISGIYSCSTLILASNFQHMMQLSHIPIYLFGLVYFVNYFIKGVASLIAPKILSRFNVKNIISIVYCLFSFSILTIIFSYFTANRIFTFLSLFLCCIAIGSEIVFYNINIAHLHDNTFSKSRATISSVNTTVCKFSQSVFLTSFKFILIRYNITFALLIYLIIFTVIFLLIKNKILI